jgi:hypothetical protein
MTMTILVAVLATGFLFWLAHRLDRKDERESKSHKQNGYPWRLP